MQLKNESGMSYGEDIGEMVTLDRSFDEGSPIVDGEDRRGQLPYELGRNGFY